MGPVLVSDVTVPSFKGGHMPLDKVGHMPQIKVRHSTHFKLSLLLSKKVAFSWSNVALNRSI